MSRANPNSAAQPYFVPRIRGLRESALWLCAGLAVIFFLALASYHATDLAFSVSGDNQMVQNRMGPAGAWFADIAYLLFGAPAYLFPALVLLAGLVVFKGRNYRDRVSRSALLWRSGGFILMLAASCGLATLHFLVPGLRETAGGIVGQLVGAGLEQILGLLGATVLLLVIWLAAVSLATGVSWLAVMDRTGRGVLATIGAAEIAVGRIQVWLAGRRAKQQRHELVTRSRSKSKLNAPKIEPLFESVESSARLERERQVPLFEPPASSELPALALLDDPPQREGGYSQEALAAMSRLVELKLADFGVEAEVVSVRPGPVVTRFELKPAPGVKVNQITNLSKDLARSLSTVSVRVVEIIPGKPYVGLEIPNEVREMVALGEIIKSRVYDDLSSPLTLALGKDIGGQPVVADLAKMPHLLIAGTTGSGKSVALNAMVLSLLYKASPEHVRLIMIDPKMLELSVYEGIPHLLAPVVTNMKEAANALRWCVAEMERRYTLMAGLGVRHLTSYNRKVKRALDYGTPIPDPTFTVPEGSDEKPPELQPLPYIVVIIDELADMMMMVGKKVEELIARLAQKARASGIHMIIATQRPSVDVITGLIKANIPARMAFQVSAKVDSRTILDQMGAEQLLGHGDMLFLPPGTSIPTRIHGAFVSDNEVHSVVRDLRGTGTPAFIDEILSGPSGDVPGIDSMTMRALDGEQDPLYDQAVRIVTQTRKASISSVQRRLKIGYNRAARMVETMEEAGIVGSLQTNGFREVLAPPPPSDD
ncbi:MAG: DNA translocase FtsK [Gammaproteobacteria bacterium]|nr:MAG: DNA translocase FtsK [Gammaproteobacteria bacterium]